MHPCSCCGYLTLPESQGSYEICELCGWQDDEVQQRWPGYAGGANEPSLCAAQAAFLPRLPGLAAESARFARAPDWRPLEPRECVEPESELEREPYVLYWRRRYAN